MLLLVFPKLLGLGAGLVDAAVRRGFGGAGGLALNAFAEVVLSALMAPIMMLLQTRHAGEILLGRESGWALQERGRGVRSWGAALRVHRLHAALGLLGGAAIGAMKPMLIAWLSPVLAGRAALRPTRLARNTCRPGPAPATADSRGSRRALPRASRCGPRGVPGRRGVCRHVPGFLGPGRPVRGAQRAARAPHRPCRDRRRFVAGRSAGLADAGGMRGPAARCRPAPGHPRQAVHPGGRSARRLIGAGRRQGCLGLHGPRPASRLRSDGG